MGEGAENRISTMAARPDGTLLGLHPVRGSIDENTTIILRFNSI